MSATWALTRSKLRRQMVALFMVAIAGGLGLGFAMTAVNGARRADSAYTRLRNATLAPDAFLDATGLDDQDLQALADVPGVRGVARFSYTPVAPSALTPGVDGGAFVGLDADFLSRVYRPLILSGRLAAPGARDEVVVNEALASAADLEPGDRVPLVSGFEHPVSIGEATVVGVVRGTFDVGANAGNASMLLSKAFLDAHRQDVQVGPQPGALVRLAHGEADLPRFQRDASTALDRDTTVLFSGGDEAAAIERTLAVQTIGLGILAVIAGLATVAAVVQALSRLLDRALTDLPILVAIGVRSRQRLALGGLLVLPVVAIGGLVATGVAFLASPLIPTGFARAVDPVSGRHLDLLIMSGLVMLWALAIGGAGVVLAWRLHDRPVRPRRSPRTRRLLRSLPPQVRLGGDAALVPINGKGGIASRSALVTAVISVAGVVAIVTFGTSLTRLLDTPSLQGWAFDAVIVNGDSDLDALRESLARLPQDDAVRNIAWVAVADILIEGQPIEVYAFDPDGGHLHPTMRSGRPPFADDEVALGADVLSAAGRSLGDTIAVSGPSGVETTLEIVGSASYPELGNNSDLGTAASITRVTAKRLGATEHGGAALIRLAPGQSAAALTDYSSAGEVVTPFRAARVRNLEQIGRLPLVLAAFVAGVGLLAVGHGLWVSIHARRRDLALLASIGFRPRDIRAMLLWQATCIAAVGTLFGVIAGIVLGTDAWSAVAAATAVVDDPAIPVLAVVLVTGATFVACNIIGLAAAQTTRRGPTTDALRGE